MAGRLYRKRVKIKRTKRKHFLTFIIAVFLLTFFAGTVFFGKWPGFTTGNVVLGFDKESFGVNETISGDLELILKEGELIPADTVINVFFDNKTKQITLEDFIGDNYEIINGSFYLANADIKGKGEGYGVIGLKEDYSLIDFQLEKYVIEEDEEADEESGNEESEDNETAGNETLEPENNETEDKDGSENDEPENNETSDNETAESEDEETEEESGESEDEEAEESSEEETEESSEEEAEEESGGETEEESDGSEDKSDFSETKADLITGAVISNSDIVNGQCSFENPFIYEIWVNELVEVIPDSVKLSETGEQLDDSVLIITIKSDDNKTVKIAKVETDYTIKEKGFGRDYLTEKEYKIILDISEMDLASVNLGIQTLKITFEYKGKEIVKVEKQIEILNISEEKEEENITNVTNSAPVLRKNIPDQTISLNSSKTIDISNYFYDEDGDNLEFDVLSVKNISILIEDSIALITPDINFTGNRTTKFYASDGNLSAKSNLVQIKVVENITTNVTVNITTFQHSAVIGEPVRWVKEINLSKSDNITVKLPEEAINITVMKIVEETEEGEDKEEVKLTAIIRKTDEGKMGKLVVRRITGMTVTEEQEIEDEEEIEIELTENATEYEIIYETPAPQAFEQEILPYKKQITIIGPENLHYENVTAYTNITRVVSLDRKEMIKLYWFVNGTKQLVENITYVDSNSNNLINRIEWIVPHLSNQTYELIIEIIKAEHLDSNRQLISDIYKEVEALDNIWSGPINNNEYIRVTFRKPLDKTRDITLYPRVISGNPEIEVYEVNGTEKVAEFTNIISNQYHKVYLTDLQGTQDVFDLRVINGIIEFDHIIDPSTWNSKLLWEFDEATASNETYEILDTSDDKPDFTGALTKVAVKIDVTNAKNLDNGDGIQCNHCENSICSDLYVIGSKTLPDEDWNAEGIHWINSTASDLLSRIEHNGIEDEWLNCWFVGTVNGGDALVADIYVDLEYTPQLPDDAPNVTLNSPENTYNSSLAEITFNCTAYDDINLINVTLYGNWTGSGWHANETNSSGINDTDYIFSKTISDDLYKWNCQACDNASNCIFNDTNRTFRVDITAPSISATQANISTATVNDYVRVNCTATDAGIGIDKFTIEADKPTSADANYSTTHLAGDTYYADIQLTEKGAWSFKCWVNDTLGNTADMADGTINVSAVNWNQSLLNIGLVLQGNNKTKNATVTAIGDNTGVAVTNVSGNGTGFITAIPTDLGDMSNDQQEQVMFNCTPSASQAPDYYDVIFNVNSTNDTEGDNITVSCNITQINMSFVSPTPGNDTRQIANSITINVSVNGTNNIDACELTWDNGTGEINISMTKEGSGTEVYCSKTKSTVDGTIYWYRVYANDSDGAANATDNMTFRENTKPSIVTLTSPADGNHTTNRTPAFDWSDGSDNELDSLTYQLNITAICNSPECESTDNRLKNITESTYTLNESEKLKNLYEAGDYPDFYNWTLLVWDGYEWSDACAIRTIYIDSSVVFSMINNSVNFGSLDLGDIENTTDNNPHPLLLQNEGNCYLDINMTTSSLLWDTQPSASQYFQYKIDKYSGLNSFNWSGSITSLANISTDDLYSIKQLNYTSGNNRSEIDLAVEVPEDELPGSKSSTLVFTGWYVKDP